MAEAQTGQALGIVDCDVHPHFRRGVGELAKYMPEAWRRRLGMGNVGDWTKDIPATTFTIPFNMLYINSAGAMRRDTIPADGSPPASDPRMVVEQLLDPYGIDRAVLIGGNILGLGALPDPDMAAAVASAFNDWLADVWLSADARFRGGIVVAPQDPQKAAAEIERVAGRPGMAQVYLPLTNILMGERHYYPIYAAAARHGLPVGIHPNSVDGVFRTGPGLAGGTFTYYTEWHTALTQVFQSNVISLIAHGVFETFPDLKVIVHEGGFGWLADTMWRFDKNWQALRDEIPWVKRPPSEYIRDHVWFTTQPFIEPKNKAHLLQLFEMIDADQNLLFSSDYPHWDFDNPLRVFQPVPETTRRRILVENARVVYGDRL